PVIAGGGAGFLLGIGGLLQAPEKKGRRLVLPLAGPAVNLQALVVALLLTYAPDILNAVDPPPEVKAPPGPGPKRLVLVIKPPAAPSISDLRETLSKSASARARVKAATGLGDFGKGIAGVVPDLTESLTDKDARVRRAAAEALGRIGSSARVAFALL